MRKIDAVGLLSRRIVFLLLMIALWQIMSTQAAVTTVDFRGATAVTSVPVGFTFNYYKQAFQYACINRNGVMVLHNKGKSPNCGLSYNPWLLPNNANTLYVGWSTVFLWKKNYLVQYETRGEAPHRQFIVQWGHFTDNSQRAILGDMQAILYEDSNKIKYQYRLAETGERLNSYMMTIGIEGPNKQIQPVSQRESNAFTDRQAILFTPNAQQNDYSLDLAAEYAFIDLNQLAPPAIFWPPHNGRTEQPDMTVSGVASAADRVQLWLDGKATGEPVAVSKGGRFSLALKLAEEGSHQLMVEGLSDSLSAARSAEVTLHYQRPAPEAGFITPAAGAVLSGPTDIEVVINGSHPISAVEFYSDDTQLGRVTAAPYRIHWDNNALADGSYTLKAVVTSATGHSTTLMRPVGLRRPQAVTGPQFSAEITRVLPEVSWGADWPVQIAGQVRQRDDGQAAASTPLVLLLSRDGFQRRIAIQSDAQGAFSYRFVPQPGDNGSWQLAVAHRDEAELPVSCKSFRVEQVTFNHQRYSLRAARLKTIPIALTATAPVALRQLRWVLRASDQPDGKLPQGITIDGGKGVDIGAGNRAPLTLNFSADEQAPASGTLVLAALEKSSGEAARARLRLSWQLLPAAPELAVTPAEITAGVRPGENVTAAFRLENRGGLALTNPELRLLDAEGNSAPGWLFISSGAPGALAAGAGLDLQLTAQPDASVAQGIYLFRLRVDEGGRELLNAPLRVTVSRAGEASLELDVADIFTATPDAAGEMIPGLADATIRLQNEAVPTQESRLVTDKNGRASIDNLAPGIWLWQASAPGHQESHGRLILQPGVNRRHLFLEYQTVGIEFDVRETPLRDSYDIELNTTFITQVPAPVVVLEPAAINLADMQPGEIRQGAITVTNYGLQQADNLRITLPQSDDHYRYEFLNAVPDALGAKERFTLLWRVTANAETNILPHPQSARSLKAKGAATCSAYSNALSVRWQSVCASGDLSQGLAGAHFYRLQGSQCDTGHLAPLSGSGGSGAVWQAASSDISVGESCSPDCSGECCSTEGAGAANQ